MLKRIAAAGILTGAIGGVILTAAGTAQADEWPGGSFWRGPENFQVLPIQTCRGIDVAGIGAAIHNVLGYSDDSGPCVNGPVTVHVAKK